MHYTKPRFLRKRLKRAVKIIDPGDFDGIDDVNSTKAIGNYTHNHIPCFNESIRKFPESANRVNLPKINKKVCNSQNPF